MNSDRFRKIADFLKSPFGAGAALIAVVFVVLIVVSVVNIIKQKNNNIDYVVTYEYDPASETEIAFFPPTDGTQKEPGPIYVASEKVIKSGVPVQHWIVFARVIERYAAENDLDLSRVSYLHDSYNLAATYIFDFKVVLNIDQQTISVRIDASKNWDDILGSVYILSDEAGNELYRFEVTEENKCQFDGTCSGS